MTGAALEREQGLVGAGRWRVEPQRWTVGFAIRHSGVAMVRGTFGEFAGTLDHDEHGTRIAAAVRTASLDTGNQLRDDCVRGT